EEVADPRLKSLISMVHQNAGRLERIVDGVLNISRLHRPGTAAGQTRTRLDNTVAEICLDWTQQNPQAHRLKSELRAGASEVMFDPEHLRRVVVNLLENARRYADGGAES